MKPAILITGGAGYIGSHTAYMMHQKGYKVIILDTFLHNQQPDLSWATIIKKDFADMPTLQMIFSTYNIQAVMHFAALIQVGQSVTDPASFYQNNVAKTITLLDTMIQHGIKKFIFSSSCAIYGKPFSLPLTEELPKTPISPYGKTKLMVEILLKDFKKAYELEYVSLRYFNAAGAMPQFGLGEEHTPETHIIPLLLRSALEQKPFSIFGTDYQTKDGSCIRDFIHIWDIAHAHYLALTYLQSGNPSDCFNLGTGKGFSVNQLIRAVEHTCGCKIEILHARRRKGDPPILIADPTKAYNVLGWKPHFSHLDSIITSAYEFEVAKRAKIKLFSPPNQQKQNNL